MKLFSLGDDQRLHCQALYCVNSVLQSSQSSLIYIQPAQITSSLMNSMEPCFWGIHVDFIPSFAYQPKFDSILIFTPHVLSDFCFVLVSLPYFPIYGYRLLCGTFEGTILSKQQPAKEKVGTQRGCRALSFTDLYSACVCNLRVTDWRSELSIDCSEDVIEAGVMGSRT